MMDDMSITLLSVWPKMTFSSKHLSFQMQCYFHAALILSTTPGVMKVTFLQTFHVIITAAGSNKHKVLSSLNPKGSWSKN